MMRFQFKKLIRDKLVEMMESKHILVAKKSLDPDGFALHLKHKLLEEVHELLSANTNETIIEELADVLEVIYSLLEVLNISRESLEEQRVLKRQVKGGFDNQIFVEYVELAKDNPNVAYYIEQPLKYPDITPND